jgi:hypothetical protein
LNFQFLNKLSRVVIPFELRLENTVKSFRIKFKKFKADDAEDPERLYTLYAVVIHIGRY